MHVAGVWTFKNGLREVGKFYILSRIWTVPGFGMMRAYSWFFPQLSQSNSIYMITSACHTTVNYMWRPHMIIQISQEKPQNSWNLGNSETPGAQYRHYTLQTGLQIRSQFQQHASSPQIIHHSWHHHSWHHSWHQPWLYVTYTLPQYVLVQTRFPCAHGLQIQYISNYGFNL